MMPPAAGVGARPATPLRLLTFVALLWIVGTLVGGIRPARAADEPASVVTMDVQPLLDGIARAGEWAAIRVHLENPGPAVRGQLRVTTADRTASSYGVEIELPTGARQDHVIHTLAGPFGSRMTVNLVADGATIASAKTNVRNLPPESLGIYVVAEHPERLVGDIRASRDGRFASEIVDVAAADLPPRVEAWSAVDRLVWQDVPTGSLDAQQLDALVTWVALGGDLIIVGGSAGSEVVEALPDELLPYRPDGTIDVPAVDLAGLIGGLPPGAAPVPALAGELARGSVLAESAGKAVAARAAYGQGGVTLIGFDPSAPWLTGTSVGSALWARILPAASTADRTGSATLNADILLDALTYLPAIEAPRMDQLLLLFLGYLILLGPVNYLVLRRLDRREWAWVTIPALAVLFTLGALTLGIVLRGSNVVINQLGIVQGAAGTDRGVADVFVGVFSPTRATFDVSLPGGAFVSQPIREWEERERSPLDVTLGDTSRVHGLQVGYGDLRGLRAQATVPTPRIDTALRLKEGRVSGTVTNASDTPLEHAALVQGGGMQLLGDIAPGETRTVDVPPGRALNTTLASLARLAGAPDEPTVDDQRGLASRLSIIRALSGEWWWDDGSVPDPLRDLGPVLIAWRSGGALDVDVGAPASRTGDTLYLLPVRVSVTGPVVLLNNLFRRTVLDIRSADAWQDPQALYLTRGTMTVDYRPTRFEATMDVTDLVLRLDDRANQPASDVTEVLAPLPEAQQPDQEDPVRETPIEAPGGWSALRVQLLDHEADTWVEFGPMARAHSYRIGEPARFVDPAGVLRVRFVSRGIDTPAFGLGLRLEGVVR